MASRRRDHATFLYPPDAPTQGEEWEKQTYREHIKGWNQQVVGDGSALPGVLYTFVIVRCPVSILRPLGYSPAFTTLLVPVAHHHNPELTKS